MKDELINLVPSFARAITVHPAFIYLDAIYDLEKHLIEGRELSETELLILQRFPMILTELSSNREYSSLYERYKSIKYKLEEETPRDGIQELNIELNSILRRKAEIMWCHLIAYGIQSDICRYI